MDKDTHANLRQKKSGVAILPTGKSRCQSRDDYQVQKWTVYILFVIPWTVAHQTRLSMEFSRQEYWSRKPFPSPGDLSNPRIKPRSPALQAVSLPAEPPGKPWKCQESSPKSFLTVHKWPSEAFARVYFEVLGHNPNTFSVTSHPLFVK